MTTREWLEEELAALGSGANDFESSPIGAHARVLRREAELIRQLVAHLDTVGWPEESEGREERQDG